MSRRRPAFSRRRGIREGFGRQATVIIVHVQQAEYRRILSESMNAIRIPLCHLKRRTFQMVTCGFRLLLSSSRMVAWRGRGCIGRKNLGMCEPRTRALSASVHSDSVGASLSVSETSFRYYAVNGMG